MTPRTIPLARTSSDEPLGIAYGRYSTVQQGSITEQHAINDEIAADEGVRIVAYFQDEGLSRSLSERPDMLRAFDYLEKNPNVHYLVMPELERLTAGISQRQKVVRMCKRLRITLLTEDLGLIDPHDEEKMLQADELSIKAKREVMKISRRTRRNLRQKVIAGTVAMRPAYGTRMKPLQGVDGQDLPSGMSMIDAKGKRVTSGVLELHPDEIEWLRKIFEWADGGMSSDQIARNLTEKKVPTKSGKAQWRGNTINGILDNPLYKGVMMWGHQQVLRDEDGEPYLEVREEGDRGRVTRESPLGAIIDPIVWDRIHAFREARVNQRRMARRVNEPHVFDDYVYCARCGHRMYGRNEARPTEKPRWRYFCYSMRPGYTAQPGFKRVCDMAHSMSERQIFNLLQGLSKHEGAKVTVTRGQAVDVDDQRGRLAATITENEEIYDRAVALAVKGLLDDERLAKEKKATDDAIAAARKDLAALSDHTEVRIPWAGDMAKAWAESVAVLSDPALPIEARVQVLRDAGLMRIYLDKPDLRLQLLD